MSSASCEWYRRDLVEARVLQVGKIDAGRHLLAAKVQSLVVGNHLGEDVKHALEKESVR